MKHLLLSLLVAFMLASCGNSNGNKVSSDGNYSNPIISEINGKAHAEQLVDKINHSDNYFGYGSYFQTGMTWKQAVEYYYTKGKYRYSNWTTSSSNANCEIKWKIFYVCKQTSSTTSPTISREVSVDNSEAGKMAKRAELKGILSRARHVTFNGLSYYILTDDGTYYEVNVGLPLQANPSTKQLANGTAEYLSQFAQY